ncbi:hypothetical protein [Lentzea sp. NPDC059081]|uniref:hypothetical protein n=1 Tax=Lentzea sp. NPDC059081 TaxID=3346719 RepID=UPI0036A2EEEA
MVVCLPAWPGDTASSANAVNASGVIVGDSSNTQRRHAVRWAADGSVTDLETLPGGRYAAAEAVNASGLAAGYSYDSPFGQRAVRWGVDGVVTDLGALPGDSESYAWGIISAGAIVGSSRGSGGLRPVRWDPDGTITPLGNGNGAALAINDSGQITGCTNRNGLLDPTLWSPDGCATTLVPAPGHTSGSARINASGTVFGSSGTTNGDVRWHAAVWGEDGVAQLLGDLSEGDTSVVRWTNDAHTSVGWATRGGVTYAVRWASNGPPREGRRPVPRPRALARGHGPGSARPDRRGPDRSASPKSGGLRR